MTSERPQNRNLKSLGTGQYTPEEEREIRVKGAKAAHAAMRRNADIRRAVAAVARLNMNGIGRAANIETLKSVEDLSEKNAPLLARIIYQQCLMAINGDKEARDWICKYLVDDAPSADTGLTIEADDQELDGVGGSVRIHLIRAEKPHSTENTATAAADRLAVVEAIQAAGEAADRIADATGKAVMEVLAQEDTPTPGES